VTACPRPEKVAYPNHWEASAARRRIRRATGWPLQAYRCRCGAFHLGNPRKPVVAVLEAENQRPRYRNTPSGRRAA
jgi:hypothetical protein